MPRGQYDRAAAKAKHEAEDTPRYELIHGSNVIIEQLQSKLDAANALIARYQALLKRNGLWLD